MAIFKSPIKALLLLCMVVMLALPAVAQVSGPDKPVAGATPGGVNNGSASDAELWRQIRRGDQGTVVGGDKSGGMMIQSGGQEWRLMREGPLPKYVAWAILGMLLLLSLFFALRGRMKVKHGLAGSTIKRFSLIERAGHWLLASSFILLALTGLNLLFGKALLVPVLGKDNFASITLFGKFIHNYVAFAFILGLIMIVVMWVWHNIPGWTDVKWLLRAGGMLGGGHPPAKKFNAGQKIIFWIVVLCGISISMSGWALMNPFTTNMFGSTFALANDWFGTSYATDLAPIQEQQYQALWHTVMAAFMIAVILAHIYIGSIGMQGALPAMTTGDVDVNWAREHHSLWVEEEEAKNWGKPKLETPAVPTTAKVRAKSVESPVRSESSSTIETAAGLPSKRLAALSADQKMDTPISEPMPVARTSRPTPDSSKPLAADAKSRAEDIFGLEEVSKPIAKKKPASLISTPDSSGPAPAKKVGLDQKATVARTTQKQKPVTKKTAKQIKRVTKVRKAKTGAEKSPSNASQTAKFARITKPRSDVQKSATVKKTAKRARAADTSTVGTGAHQAVAGGMALNTRNADETVRSQMTPRARALAKAAAERSGVVATTSGKVVTRTKSATKASGAPKRKRASTASNRTLDKKASESRDDLKRIKGIGPQNEKKLNAIGVTRFADVAKWTKKQQQEIGDRLAFPGRIEREDWVKQAQVLARSSKKG